MRKLVFLLATSLFLAGARKDDDDQARRLVSQLSLDEKISLLHGVDGPYTGNLGAIPRLQIPPLHVNDGPQGFNGPEGTSTAWPCSLSMAATWDRRLVYQWGRAMGREFLAKGANVILGPGLNVHRIPRNGRNFEYLSGEDPVLGAKLIAREIRGIQNQGVIANVKHFVHNNQEQDRFQYNAIVDERTHWELYMPPWEAAVEAGVLSVMCSYNRINGYAACESNSTMNGDLKDRLQFPGFILSDWGATRSTIPAAMSGLDMEMPSGGFYAQPLKEAVESKQLPLGQVDSMVQRVLHAMIVSGAMNRTITGTPDTNVTSPEHNQLAREFAAAGVVLLKNDDQSLPLSRNQSILVIGDIIHTGGGSGGVAPPYVITGYQGIQQKATHVYYSPMEQPDFSKVDLVDKVVIFTATTSGEGDDRKDLSFPADEIKVIETVIATAPHKVIVVAIAPGAVLLPFADQMSTLLLSFLPGQEGGNAIADVLFGDVNPSGRLPLTLPNSENETGFTPDQYPGVNFNANYSEQLLTGYRWYDAHGQKPKFAFGFGLSYTTFVYSNLNVKDSRYRFRSTNTGDNDPNEVVSFRLTNTGDRDGYEIAQIYVWFPLEVGEPPKLLKNFQKVFLKAGESKKVQFELSQRDLSIWNVKSHGWQTVEGLITVTVGPASDNQPLQGTIVKAYDAAVMEMSAS